MVGRLLVEFEIAVRIASDLKPPRGRGTSRHDRYSVLDAVDAVAPAMELADDRCADYDKMAQHGLQLLADNAWNEGAILGRWRRDWRSLGSANEGIGSLSGTALINDEVVGQGYGRDLMGHPLEALAWLANEAWCARNFQILATGSSSNSKALSRSIYVLLKPSKTIDRSCSRLM
ncbi:MAG: hypothetical protein EBS62_01870 [Betaproteobacteria bacterium]|nr:hypothetical protein [Betaproteobacteria bacterium]